MQPGETLGCRAFLTQPDEVPFALSLTQISDRLRLDLLGQLGWAGGGQLLGAVGALVTLRVLTELVTPSTFGLVALLLGAVVLANNTLGGPPIEAMIRYYPDYRAREAVPTLRSLTRSVLVRRVSLLSIGYLVLGCAVAFQTRESLMVAVSLSVFALFELGVKFESGLLLAARRQRAVAWVRASNVWLRAPAVGLLVLGFQESATTVLAGYALASGALLSVLVLSGKREGVIQDVRPESSSDVDTDRDQERLLSFSRPLYILPVLTWLGGVGDRYIVGAALGTSSVGIYSAGYNLVAQAVSLVAGTLLTFFQPVYFSLTGEQRHGKAKRVLVYWFLIAALLLGILTLFLFVFGSSVGDLILGAEFRVPSVYLGVLGLGMSFRILAMILEQPCRAAGRTEVIPWIHAVGAAGTLLLVWPFVVRWGLPGAVAAVPVYFGLQLVAAIWANASIQSGGK